MKNGIQLSYKKVCRCWQNSSRDNDFYERLIQWRKYDFPKTCCIGGVPKQGGYFSIVPCIHLILSVLLSAGSEARANAKEPIQSNGLCAHFDFVLQHSPLRQADFSV